ncbi:FtsK/SpoIIIE domain-containing protein [Catellatospora sp. KI3]|uniref:FtsK/SpoIIIE domain-containing protein n=1 Tax=Catellatospora sp. KI3 TaxID=3041620 RepID=UPI002482B8F8|nr:FtsK/SpoIIIE domain-containing protein [Catellatospora sp. KI3]MDI1465085.1 FtsK/SpoIIIE domain-containing protein [Catellatospora sp. KI3]
MSALDSYLPPPRTDLAEQHDLAERLRGAAARLAPGWLGARLDGISSGTPLGDQRRPEFVRVGTARPLDDDQFPLVVPLLGTGHLTFGADSRDPRVAGALRSVLLRLLATAPSGTLVVRAVDAVGGALFAPFGALADAGLMPPPVHDLAGLQAVLAEAEHWVRPSRPIAQRRPTARPRRRDCTMLLLIAALPSNVEGAELTRITALAQAGPAAGLHLIVAGWPPPPLSPHTSQPSAQAPLPTSTQIVLRNPYALVGGGPFATQPPGDAPSPTSTWPGLSVPVELDPDPPADLVHRVCRELAARYAASGQVHLMDLLPDPDQWWAESSAAGLSTTVGLAGEAPIPLSFTELTPHWLVAGRASAGKTAFLTNVLYGLCTRYDPDELALYLLDFARDGAYAEFAPSGTDPAWLPHARVIGGRCTREAGLEVLRGLTAELDRRVDLFGQEGVPRFGQFRELAQLPRVVCVLEEFPVLLAGDDPVAKEAVGLLESLARRARGYGMHLILSSRSVRAVADLHARRDSAFGQFPVRVALPGGADVLEATNDAAASLPVGCAVVNTAGGLGGPRNATRGHEKTVRFPDPHTDLQVLTALRQRLWQARDLDSDPPVVLIGSSSEEMA